MKACIFIFKFCCSFICCEVRAYELEPKLVPALLAWTVADPGVPAGERLGNKGTLRTLMIKLGPFLLLYNIPNLI